MAIANRDLRAAEARRRDLLAIAPAASVIQEHHRRIAQQIAEIAGIHRITQQMAEAAGIQRITQQIAEIVSIQRITQQMAEAAGSQITATMLAPEQCRPAPPRPRPRARGRTPGSWHGS